jgi:hypothetical protein
MATVMAHSGAPMVAPAVSPADLRAKLYASLTSAGVVDGLKTQLRSQLLSNLHATSPQVRAPSIHPPLARANVPTPLAVAIRSNPMPYSIHHTCPPLLPHTLFSHSTYRPDPASYTLDAAQLTDGRRIACARVRQALVVRVNPPPATAQHRLAAALVAEYLHTARLPYTLSLFLPEAGLSGPSQRQSRDEITAALRLTAADGAAATASALARAFDGCVSRTPHEPLALQLLTAITGATPLPPHPYISSTLQQRSMFHMALTVLDRAAVHTPQHSSMVRVNREDTLLTSSE